LNNIFIKDFINSKLKTFFKINAQYVKIYFQLKKKRVRQVHQCLKLEYIMLYIHTVSLLYIKYCEDPLQDCELCVAESKQVSLLNDFISAGPTKVPAATFLLTAPLFTLAAHCGHARPGVLSIEAIHSLAAAAETAWLHFKRTHAHHISPLFPSPHLISLSRACSSLHSAYACNSDVGQKLDDFSPPHPTIMGHILKKQLLCWVSPAFKVARRARALIMHSAAARWRRRRLLSLIALPVSQLLGP
jgi:hypothetical protein